MYTLFPAIKPNERYQFSVDSGHEIYVEESGDPNGLPVLVLHGGPGVGSEPALRRYFDPEKFRIILFDQRGCGRSTPHCSTEHNTSQDLINDIEHIRKQLNISKMTLFGIGWGATLALLYTHQHPQHINNLMLSGVFLARKQDLDWYFKQGCNQIFPDHWLEFCQAVNSDGDDILDAYQSRLSGNDDLARMAAAKAWATWQAQCASLQPRHTIMDFLSEPHIASSLAAIQNHYCRNNFFIEENSILSQISGIDHIPLYLIHGRYDMVSPLRAAWQLHASWANSELYVVRDAGHSIKEAGIIDALIITSQKIAKTSRNQLA